MSLETYMLIATISIVVFGLLLGLLRGSRRSVLRLLLVLLCVVGAYFLKDVITSALMKVEIQGKNIENLIIDKLPENIQNMSDVCIPLATTIIAVLSFFLGFVSLQFLSWAILFPILKIVVKKGKKKHALVGGLVGAVQGVAVAFVICVILNGLFVNIGNIMTAMDTEQQQGVGASIVTVAAGDTENGADGNGADDGQQGVINLENIYGMLKSYPASSISQAYGKIGNKAFNLVSTVKMQDQDGNVQKYTLKGQMDAVLSMLKLAQNADKLQNIQLGTDGIAGCADSIKEVFDLLDEINKDLSAESQETLNKVIKSVADNMLPADLPVDITVIDFTTVDFASEGEIITDLASYANKTSITEADAQHIVDKVMDSNLIIPLLTSTGEIDLGFNEVQKQEALKIVRQYETNESYDAEKVAKVKDFLGLTNFGGTTNS